MKQITSGGNWLFNWSRFSLGVAQIAVCVLTVALLGSCNEGKDASPSSKGGVSAPEMTPLIAKVVELSADLAKVKQESLFHQQSAEALAKNYEQCQQSNIQLTNAVKAAETKASDAFATAEQRQRELASLQIEKADVDKLLAIGTSRADILQRLGGPIRGFRCLPTRWSYEETGYEDVDGRPELESDRQGNTVRNFTPTVASDYMWLNDDGTGGRNGFSKVVSKKRFWEPKKDQTIKRSNMDYGSHYRFQHMFEKTFEFTAQGKADADFVARHLPNTLVGNGGEGKPVTAFQWDGYLVFFDPKDNLIFWCRPAK